MSVLFAIFARIYAVLQTEVEMLLKSSCRI